MNLYDAIFKKDLAGRTAILYERRRISYAELRDLTLAFARALRALGVDRGDRLALLLNDSPEFIAAFVSICSYGAIAVPINMGLRIEEQRAILNNCTARLAIVEEDLCEALLKTESELNDLKRVVVVSRGENNRGFTPEPQSSHLPSSITKVFLAELLSESRQQPVPEFPSPDQNQPAFILYTSGSTGEPKGAVHRQSDIFYTNETYCREVLRLREGDRLFSSSRLPFAYGLGNAFSFPLLNGCTTILCREKPVPEIIAKAFADYKPTIFFGVPVVYRLLLDEAKKHSGSSTLDCSSLRLCISAGEALPAQLGEDWEKTLAYRCLTELARPRCCICGCLITWTMSSTAAAANYCKVTRPDCLTPREIKHHSALKGIFGSKARAQPSSIGNGLRLPPTPSWTAGCAPEIYTGRMPTVIGFTWVVPTTASNQAANGFRR